MLPDYAIQYTLKHARALVRQVATDPTAAGYSKAAQQCQTAQDTLVDLREEVPAQYRREIDSLLERLDHLARRSAPHA